MNATIRTGRGLFPTLAAVLAVGLLLGQTPVSAHDRSGWAQWKPDRIEGLWLATVTLTNCTTREPLPFPGATFDAMGMFADDGTFHNTDEHSPNTASSVFGIWKHLGGRNYEFAFRLFRFDETGTLNVGSQIVRHKAVLARDGKSYTSAGTAEFYDVSGIRMLPDGCSRTTAMRFE